MVGLHMYSGDTLLLGVTAFSLCKWLQKVVVIKHDVCTIGKNL